MKRLSELTDEEVRSLLSQESLVLTGGNGDKVLISERFLLFSDSMTVARKLETAELEEIQANIQEALRVRK